MSRQGQGKAEDGASPTKKRKTMHAPDGFESLKRQSAGKTPARKFTSAFDDPKRSKLTSMDSPLNILCVPVRKSPTIAQAGPSHESDSRVLLQPPIHTSDSAQAGPSKQASNTRFTRDIPLRLPKTPSFPSAPGSSTKFTLKSHLPVLTSAKSQSPSRLQAKSTLKASIHKFKPLLPPKPESSKPKRALHVLQPPVPPRRGPLLPDGVKLKTILTTRLAIAIDPLTESGAGELLALHLGHNAPTYVPPAERELNRGLGQSPEKASKSKSAKYIRGGLAERAQAIFTRQNTSLALWYQDLQLQAKRPGVHTPVAPDLSLRVLKVLHVTSVASLQRSQNAPRLSILSCAKLVKGRAIGHVTALLDFGTPGSVGARAHTLDEVKEESVVHVWYPWGSTDAGNEELHRFGALPRDGSTLFCTRFRLA